MNKTDPLISALEIVGLVMMAMGILISLTAGAIEPAILFPIGATFYFISFYLNRRNELRESRRRELAAMYPKRVTSPAGLGRGLVGDKGLVGAKGLSTPRRSSSSDTSISPAPYVDNSYLYTSSDSYSSDSSCSSSYDSSSSSSSDSGGSCGGSD